MRDFTSLFSYKKPSLSFNAVLDGVRYAQDLSVYGFYSNICFAFSRK
jgi:hypothetical protein